MKILILTPGVYPDRHSGLPKVAYNIAKEMSALGHELTILTRRYDLKYPVEERISGMQYYRIKIPKRGDWNHILWPLLTAIQSMRIQRRLKLEGKQFDMVWIHNPWWVFFQYPKKLWSKAKVYYNFHSDAYSEMLYSSDDPWFAKIYGRIADTLTKYVMKRSDGVVVHSEYTKKKCLSVGGEGIKTKLNLISAGVDHKLYSPASPKERVDLKRNRGLPLDRPIFITARGLKPRTGVDQLVKAASLLRKESIPFYLVIIGRGVMKEEIKSLIITHRLSSHVRLLSGIEEAELSSYYKLSDAFVLPTQGAEGFGLAVVEALSSGIAALGTNNSATPWILSHYCKDWIIDGSDALAISEKMKQFCLNREELMLSPEKIREITVKNFCWKNAANQLISIAS